MVSTNLCETVHVLCKVLNLWGHKRRYCCNCILLRRASPSSSLQPDLISLSLASCLAQASELARQKRKLAVKLSMVAELRSLWFLCLFFACKQACIVRSGAIGLGIGKLPRCTAWEPPPDRPPYPVVAMPAQACINHGTTGIKKDLAG